jgi:hypothetical protein
MNEYLSAAWYQTFYTIDHMEPQHWALVLASMIVVAAIFLRGMGSRAHQ